MDSMPLTEINMSLRRNFLMFLIGCRLHGVSVLASGPRSVVKCMSIPYFDRALLEYIFSSRGWAHSLKEYLFLRRVVYIAVKVDMLHSFHFFFQYIFYWIAFDMAIIQKQLNFEVSWFYLIFDKVSSWILWILNKSNEKRCQSLWTVWRYKCLFFILLIS